MPSSARIRSGDGACGEAWLEHRSELASCLTVRAQRIVDQSEGGFTPHPRYPYPEPPVPGGKYPGITNAISVPS